MMVIASQVKLIVNPIVSLIVLIKANWLSFRLTIDCEYRGRPLIGIKNRPRYSQVRERKPRANLSLMMMIVNQVKLIVNQIVNQV